MTSHRSNLDQNSSQQKSDFSIDHILNRAGSTQSPQIPKSENVSFSWLHCTRYCPPKLPRSQKKDGPHKRQLGRHPRIPFSSQQLAVLEEKFRQSPYLSSAEVTNLSRLLHLADIRVKIWFQNRRARERRERIEQETQANKQDGCKNENATNAPLVVQFKPLYAQNLEDTCILSTSVASGHQSTYKKLDFRNITCFVDST